MFTRGTKDFGIWRESHNSRRRFSGSPTGGFVMSLAVAAIVAWIAFIIVWKIRGELYLIESASVPLPEFAVDDAVLREERPAAVSVALIASSRASSEITILFESGRVFRFPSEESELREYLTTRADNLEYLAMLAMAVPASISRVQIWPDRRVGREMLMSVMRVFSDNGFDDFDIAMKAKGKS